MISKLLDRGGLLASAPLLALLIGSVTSTVSRAYEVADVGPCGPGLFHNLGSGTLGYGGYTLYPGWQGFGLKFHPGYGYGGRSLGPGIYGGYPFYGGPGYPCVEPQLNRFGRLTPFPFNPGPPYPRYGYSNYFSEVGPLVFNPPVAIINAPEYSGNYGCFSGTLPYPEALFAPYTAAAASTGSSMGTGTTNPPASAAPPEYPEIRPPSLPAPSSPPAAGETTALPDHVRSIGIDEEKTINADGMRAMRIVTVYPASPAEKAGLAAGDVILSANGYLTEQPGNLGWLSTDAGPGGVLKLNVRKGTDGKQQEVSVRLP